jgi:hypothetical protein
VSGCDKGERRNKKRREMQGNTHNDVVVLNLANGLNVEQVQRNGVVVELGVKRDVPEALSELCVKTRRRVSDRVME